MSIDFIASVYELSITPHIKKSHFLLLNLYNLIFDSPQQTQNAAIVLSCDFNMPIRTRLQPRLLLSENGQVVTNAVHGWSKVRKNKFYKSYESRHIIGWGKYFIQSKLSKYILAKGYNAIEGANMPDC